MISGTRAQNERVARVKGDTTGLAGATVQAMLRLSSQTEFMRGSTRVVDPQGEFSWKRRVNPSVTLEIYFTSGDVTSNTVSIPGRS